MQLKTILNRIRKYKSFMFTKVRWAGWTSAPELEVEITERANGRAVCSGCGRPRTGYDRLAARRFEFVPLWGIPVFLVYAPRRVGCPECGVREERMLWSSGKNRLTQAYACISSSRRQLIVYHGIEPSKIPDRSFENFISAFDDDVVADDIAAMLNANVLKGIAADHTVLTDKSVTAGQHLIR